MKKFLLLLLSLILIFAGIYGTFYFLALRSAEIELNNSITAVYEGNYEKAEESLKQIAARYETPVVKAPAFYLLGEMYERKGEWTAAVETYRSLLINTDIPSDSIWRLRAIISASKLYRQSLAGTSKHRTELFESYMEIIKKKLEEMERRDNLFLLAARLRRFFHSFIIPVGSRLAELFNDTTIHQDLQTELAFLYLATGKYAEAEKMFLELKTEASQLGLAQLYLQTNRFVKGIDILEDLLARDVTGRIYLLYFKEVYEQAQKLDERGAVQQAVELYEKIIFHARELQNRSFSVTDASRSSKEAKEVALHYEELASLQLARQYYRTGNYDKALSLINRVLRNKDTSKDEEALLLSGYIYYDRRQFIHALKVFNDFMRRFPQSRYIKDVREWKAMCERAIKYLN